MSRFFVEPCDVGERFITITDRDDIHHIKNVLRLTEGDIIEISDGEKWEYKAAISSVSSEEVEAGIIDKQSFAREPETKVTLFQGIPKQGKMEVIVQKCVEVGITKIVPVFMHRCVVKNDGNYWKKLVRYRKISDEAAKQCKRGILPEIAHEIDFKLLLSDIQAYDLILFPYENEENLSIKDCLRGLEKKPEKVAIIIGPEGGFADSEAEELVRCGAERVTLGKTTLRTETAGIVALAMTMYELEL